MQARKVEVRKRTMPAPFSNYPSPSRPEASTSRRRRLHIGGDAETRSGSQKLGRFRQYGHRGAQHQPEWSSTWRMGRQWEKEVDIRGCKLAIRRGKQEATSGNWKDRSPSFGDLRRRRGPRAEHQVYGSRIGAGTVHNRNSTGGGDRRSRGHGREVDPIDMTKSKTGTGPGTR
jgi:hypothetical protein